MDTRSTPKETPSCLIDAATWRSVARIFGHIRTQDRSNIDSDISALEQFVTTVLFFDEIYYLPDPRTERLITLIFGSTIPQFIRTVGITRTKIRAFESKAAEVMREDIIDISENMELSELTRRFLETIHRKLALEWEYGSKAKEYFNQITSIGSVRLDNELFGSVMGWNPGRSGADMIRSIREIVSLGGSQPQPVASKSKQRRQQAVYMSFKKTYEGLIEASKALNWLMLRTCLYSMISQEHDLYLSTHPTRSTFYASLVAPRTSIPRPVYDGLIKRLCTMSDDVSKEIRRDIFEPILDVELPMFSAWISMQGQGPAEFIQALLKVRSSSSVASFRGRLQEYQNMSAHDDIPNTIKRIRNDMMDIRTAADLLRREYYVEARQGVSTSGFVSILNSALALSGHPIPIPNFGLKIPEKFVARAFTFGKPHKAILRSIVQDLTTVPQLGRIHDRLTKNIIMAPTEGP